MLVVCSWPVSTPWRKDRPRDPIPGRLVDDSWGPSGPRVLAGEGLRTDVVWCIERDLCQRRPVVPLLFRILRAYLERTSLTPML